MPFQFASPANSPYQPGMLFLGRDPETGREIGIKTERHAITIAGARSGKGAALIVPNLTRWPHSNLTIDPKGENAALTWEAREAMGQAVHILDPFQEADIPVRLRASFNPLTMVNPTSLSAREDISVIADGLVLRHKAEDGEWYDGAVSVLAGFITHALTATPPERRNLASVKDLLNFPPDRFEQVVADMAENQACGGLASEAAALIRSQTKTSGEYLSGARRSISKFGADALQSVMTESTFNLSDLKAGRCTVFLVLPSRYVEEHARFFRLFVRLALNEMEKPLPNRTGRERLKGTPCLFILDEFYSLGRIDAVQKAAGRMAGNGVHLWPFLQDLGQLVELYHPAGSETFFGNADAQIFFGNTDPMTLDYVSRRIGTLTVADVGVQPPTQMHLSLSPDVRAAGYSPITPPRPTPTIPHQKLGAFVSTIGMGVDALRNMSYSEKLSQQARVRQAIEQGERVLATADANAMRDYHHAMTAVGKPRLAPDEIAALTGRGARDDFARSMIVFGPGGSVHNLSLAPYFHPAPPIRLSAAEEQDAVSLRHIRVNIDQNRVIVCQTEDEAFLLMENDKEWAKETLSGAGIGLIIILTLMYFEFIPYGKNALWHIGGAVVGGAFCAALSCVIGGAYRLHVLETKRNTAINALRSLAQNLIKLEQHADLSSFFQILGAIEKTNIGNAKEVRTKLIPALMQYALYRPASPIPLLTAPPTSPALSRVLSFFPQKPSG